jgi:phage I-like protein
MSEGDAQVADPTPPAPAADPPAPDPTPTPAPAPDPAPADEPFNKDRAMATITKLREQEKLGKQAARERDELAQKLQAIEDAQKSDAQKQADKLAALEAERAAWETDRQEMNLRLAVLSQAQALGVVDSDLALAALDRSALEFDDKGQPTNVSQVLTALLEAKPILKGRAQAPTAPRIDSGAGTQSDGPTPPLTSEELAVARMAGMSAEDYAKAKTANTVTDWQTKRSPATA